MHEIATLAADPVQGSVKERESDADDGGPDGLNEATLLKDDRCQKRCRDPADSRQAQRGLVSLSQSEILDI